MTNRRAEDRVRALLRPHVREVVALGRVTSRALRSQASHFLNRDAIHPHERVLAILCARVADDLRVIHALISRGHIAQAMTLGATVFELAYSMGYVGTSDDRAKKWLDHTDLRELPWLKREAMAETVQRALGAPQPRSVEREQKRYQALCAFKHGNPTLQQNLPIVLTPESFVVVVDEDEAE